MQVLCMASEDCADIACKVCGQKYKLYFERPQAERDEAIATVSQSLLNHHVMGDGKSVHPRKPFNVPEWSGPAEWSAAALLGGAPIWIEAPSFEMYELQLAGD
jgi:hypothetical protein